MAKARNCAYLLALLLVGLYSHAQDASKADSLERIYRYEQDIEAKIDIALQLINLYTHTDKIKARTKINEALKLATKKDNQRSRYRIYNSLSTYHNTFAAYDSAIYYADKSLELIPILKDSSLYFFPYSQLAWSYSLRGEYDSAKQVNLKNIEVSSAIDDWKGLSKAYFGMGNTYFYENDFPRALENYLKADSIFDIHDPFNPTSVNNNVNIAQLLLLDKKFTNVLYYLDKSEKVAKRIENDFAIASVNLIKGTYYYEISQYSLALENLTKALDFFTAVGSDYDAGETHYYLGKLYHKTKALEKAIASHKASIHYYNKIGDPHGPANSNLELGLINGKKGDFDSALEYLNKARIVYEKAEANQMLEEKVSVYKALSNQYKAKENNYEALRYANLYIALKDTLLAKQNSKQLNELETKYQTEKKEQQIRLLSTQNALAVQQKTNQRNLFIAGGSVLGLAALVFFFLFRNKQQTNTKLRELDTMKSNFFANISHEFRTPLTLVSAPILEKLEDGETPVEDRKVFEMIARNNKRLLGLVDQLLDLSKIDAGKLQLGVSEGNLGTLLGALCDAFHYLAKQRKVTFEISIDPNLGNAWFDVDMVEKITNNLLSNAFKYVPKKGEVGFTAKRATNNHLLLTVTNSLNKNRTLNTEKFFDRFYQTDPQAEGAGIGLALVKELVLLHKGNIGISQNEEEGIAFAVTLPIEKLNFNNAEIQPSKMERTYSQIPHATLSNEPDDVTLNKMDEKPLLLVVEDNPDMQLLLQSTFSKDFNVLTAPNGEEGIHKALEHVPDIIISDVMMPKKDGIALTKTLKQDERTSHVPIILLTAKAGEDNVVKGIENGADDYMVKPFSGKILKSKIHKLVALRKQLQQRYSQEVILKPADIAINSIDEQFLGKVQEVMDNSLIDSNFSTVEFSKAVGMSRMQLHRKLKALTGLSASEFIRSQRLKLAADLLKKSDTNVSQVGYAVGFNDHSYFSKCFKEAYGIAPSQYAKQA